MVISVNPEPSHDEFNSLLNSTIDELNERAKKAPKKIEQLRGNRLEPFVQEVMTGLAVGSKFENSIELIGGQKFPDIVAKKYYGIEVKTTTQNHWKTTGNSVLESTRIDDVERIFMLFGKLGSPIEFRSRAYEECLSEVVVTHSPRYLIDMNLKKGKTIFDKINISYDTLRKEQNPIKPITDYYKSKLKPGQDLWWIDQENSKSSNLVIKIWNNLSIEERQKVKNRAMVYFPELFSNRSDKFARLAIWLVTREAVVCPNVRDIFTAGGKGNYLINDELHTNIPRIFLNQKVSDKRKISDWMDLVNEYSKTISTANHLNIKNMLSSLVLK